MPDKIENMSQFLSQNTAFVRVGVRARVNYDENEKKISFEKVRKKSLKKNSKSPKFFQKKKLLN